MTSRTRFSKDLDWSYVELDLHSSVSRVQSSPSSCSKVVAFKGLLLGNCAGLCKGGAHLDNYDFRRLEGVFPDSKYSPAVLDEKVANGPVPGFVTVNFGIPVGAARLGHTAVPTAAMPEAAVNKNGHLLFVKNKIGNAD